MPLKYSFLVGMLKKKCTTLVDVVRVTAAEIGIREFTGSTPLLERVQHKS